MRILLIEDESNAARRLKRHINQVLPNAEIIGMLNSVADSIEWFSSQEPPDLVFMDIQLADGPSFDIFDATEVSAPIIFTTAYDEYALQAFKTNSIDYLLKPVKLEDLKAAIEKWQHLTGSASGTATNLETGLAELSALIRGEHQPYQQRIVIRLPNRLKAIEVDEVAYFFIESRLAFMQLKDGKQYPVDFTLDQLESRLHPKQFIRINRQFMVTFNAIRNMFQMSKSRVKLELNPPSHLEAIVSSERMATFKKWLKGEYRS